MHKLSIVIIFLWSTVAFGAPFLISDAVDPADCGNTDQPPCPVLATCYEDDVIFVSDVPVETDMSLKVDLVGRPAGNHTYKCVYQDQFGGVSLESNPTQLGPLAPANLKLIP